MKTLSTKNRRINDKKKAIQWLFVHSSRLSAKALKKPSDSRFFIESRLAAFFRLNTIQNTLYRLFHLFAAVSVTVDTIAPLHSEHAESCDHGGSLLIQLRPGDFACLPGFVSGDDGWPGTVPERVFLTIFNWKLSLIITIHYIRDTPHFRKIRRYGFQKHKLAQPDPAGGVLS